MNNFKKKKKKKKFITTEIQIKTKPFLEKYLPEEEKERERERRKKGT